MKFWKKWPYWVRGGLGVLALELVSLGIAYLSHSIRVISYTVQCLIPPCLDELRFYFFSNNWFMRTNKFVFLIFALCIGGFIVGAFLGWLYGKIKNRKINP